MAAATRKQLKMVAGLNIVGFRLIIGWIGTHAPYFAFVIGIVKTAADA